MCVLQNKKVLSIQIVIRLKEKNITTISFLNLSESTESNIPSFLVVLEFIIRIGNAKTLESAIYMLISTFGSSFHWDWIARYYT